MTTTSRAATGGARPSGRDALAVLQQQYEDRLLAAREQATAGDRTRGGSGVVGVMGSVAPVELILAAGYLPVLVAAEPPRPTPLADPWMEPEFAWEHRSLLDRTLRGDFESFDLLIVTRSYHEVYYYLKEIVRQGQGTRVPPLHMYDLMQSQRPAVRPYGIGRTEELRAALARLAGAPISDDALRAAVRLTNRRRQAMRNLLERRRSGQVSGATAIRAIGASYVMHPEAYTETLTAYLENLTPEPDLAGRPRLLVVTSEPLYHPALHDALEAAGALVVSEDDWWGARAAGRDIPIDPIDAPGNESPMAAIFEKYFSDSPTLGVSPRTPREAWLRAQIEQGDIDGVVFYLPPSDHLYGWYYPGLKEYLDERGVPSVMLRDDVLEADGPAKVGAAVVGLVSSLAQGVAR
jgi:benzoyl-CoA reductase/2-hydroxyglutaryl-CoA dehydratase subunit BcrC/BadD/HgdB